MLSLALENPIGCYIDAKKKGLSVRRKNKVGHTLVKAEREFLSKPLSTDTKEELEILIDGLAIDELKEDFADSTRVTYRKILKPFFSWLHLVDKGFANFLRFAQKEPKTLMP
ncbi:MAG TPA: hypothetical protein VN739_09485 [Nitrososphaerales archaeon]|nr:hypothetical protein [Nitrososphaerales archaeon]